MWGHPTPLGTVSALPHQFCAPDPGAPRGPIPFPCPLGGHLEPTLLGEGGGGVVRAANPPLTSPKRLGTRGPIGTSTWVHAHLLRGDGAAHGGHGDPKAAGCLQGAGAGSTLGCPYTPRTPTLGQLSLFSTASAAQPPPAASAHPAPSARPLPERGRKSAGCHGASQGSPRPPGRAPASRMEVAAGPP